VKSDLLKLSNPSRLSDAAGKVCGFTCRRRRHSAIRGPRSCAVAVRSLDVVWLCGPHQAALSVLISWSFHSSIITLCEVTFDTLGTDVEGVRLCGDGEGEDEDDIGRAQEEGKWLMYLENV